ncbi:hypothetical protein COLU111180_14900 [Cohnella lubricantis]|nr:hypothetical protein [Cohnella lubricantis]
MNRLTRIRILFPEAAFVRIAARLTVLVRNIAESVRSYRQDVYPRHMLEG